MKPSVVNQKEPMDPRKREKRRQIRSGDSGTQNRSRMPVGPLPDDVVMEILSRLPANDVLKFRRVCRKWRDLLSTQYFAEMHLKSKVYCSPLILVRSIYDSVNHDKLLLLDRWKSPRKRLTIRKVCLNFLPSTAGYAVKLSYNGFILLIGSFCFPASTSLIIFNPINGGKVTISYPRGRYSFHGMFFNPSVKEYCLLLKSSENAGDVVQFKMLNLGSQPCCRALKQQPTSFIHKPRKLPYSLLRNLIDSDHYLEPPVVIGDDDATLYWLVEHDRDSSPSCEEVVVTFDIKTEEFTLMPHPGPIDDCHSSEHLNVHLLRIDGRLSFLHISVTTMSVIINIWALKDSASRLWMKSHSVIISVDQLNIHKYEIDIDGLRGQNFRVMTVGKGELLLQYNYLGTRTRAPFCRFYACNIELGTVSRIGRTYKRSCMSTYVPSFVSLGNCKPEISI